MPAGSFGNGSEPKVTAKQRKEKENERRRRIRKTKCSIDTTLPHSYNIKRGKIIRRVDRKKRLMEKLEKKYHENENKILEKRMKSANKSMVDHRLESKYRHFKTINGPARVKYNKWLKLDNHHYHRRLKQTPATYQRKKWREWRKKTNNAILSNPYTARRQKRLDEIVVDNVINASNIINAKATFDLAENNVKYLEQKKLRLVNPYTYKRMKVLKDIDFDNQITVERMKKHVHPTYTPKKWNAERGKLKHSEETNPYTLRRRKEAERLALDNHHFQRRLNDQGPFYVKDKWLAERKKMEKKIIYMCKLNVEHKGWNVAPLIKREGLKKSPTRPTTSPFRPSPSNTNTNSNNSNAYGGNRHNKMRIIKQSPVSLKQESNRLLEQLALQNNKSTYDERLYDSDEFEEMSPKSICDEHTGTFETTGSNGYDIGDDSIRIPTLSTPSAATTINTFSNYDEYKQISKVKKIQKINGVSLHMLHIG